LFPRGFPQLVSVLEPPISRRSSFHFYVDEPLLGFSVALELNRLFFFPGRLPPRETLLTRGSCLDHPSLFLLATFFFFVSSRNRSFPPMVRERRVSPFLPEPSPQSLLFVFLGAPYLISRLNFVPPIYARLSFPEYEV